MKKILAIILTVCMLASLSALCIPAAAETTSGCVRIIPLLSGNAYYAAFYAWSGVKTKDTAINFSFYAMGAKDSTIYVDLEGVQKNQVGYTFTKDYEWELVEGSLECANDAGDQTNGYPFRIYTYQPDTTAAADVMPGYFIDNLTVGDTSATFDGSLDWPKGAWTAGSFGEYYSDTDYASGKLATSIFDDRYVTVYHKVEGEWVAYDMADIAKTICDGPVNNFANNGTSHLYLNTDGKSKSLGMGDDSSLYVEIKFNGTDCGVYTHYRCQVGGVTSGSIRVTVDGEDVTENVKGTLQAAADHDTTETAIFNVTGLKNGAHVIKLENLDVEPGVILRWLHVDLVKFGAGTKPYNPNTADMTSVFALLGVIACAGVVVASKKH